MYEKFPLHKNGIQKYLSDYGDLFNSHRRNNSEKCLQYMEGLFHEGKHNIERMNERIKSSSYQQLHHFISRSPWDDELVLSHVSKDISKIFENRAELTGLLLDESGHKKSGRMSVGVARQYIGSIGKRDNGQVGVFAALSQGDDVGLVGSRLFLPKSWTDDIKRCKKAGIPLEKQGYKTKPELALEIIEHLQDTVQYDWIGGDSLYGRSLVLRKGLQNMNKLFIMDTAENETLYLEHPEPYIPIGGYGRPNINYRSDRVKWKAKEIKESLTANQWKSYVVRQGTKGPLKRKVAILDVYIWRDKNQKDPEVEPLRLIISSNIDGSEVKYSLTNDVNLDGQEKLSDPGALYRQMQRYWVERGFQNLKDAIGMTDYQVRKWRAWHHHLTLTIMALHYMLQQKVDNEEDIPLLSCNDIKFFFAMTLDRKAINEDQVWSLIQKRHEQRQADLNRYK